MTCGTCSSLLDFMEDMVRTNPPLPRAVCAQIATNSMFSLLESAGRTTVRDIPRGLVTRQKISTPVIKWLLYQHQSLVRIQ